MDTITDPDVLIARLETGGLVDCRLEGLDCGQQTLVGATFENCTFDNCRFRSADLAEAVFADCALFEPSRGIEAGTDFSFANLRDAEFTRCDLTTATFNRIRGYGLRVIACNAQGADFSNADMSMAIGREGGLCDATFERTNLAYADLSAMDLSRCTLTGCRLVHANLDNTRLDGADLSDCELDNIEARGASMRGVDLRGASFNNLDVRQIDLAGAKITLAQTLMLLEVLDIDVEVN